MKSLVFNTFCGAVALILILNLMSCTRKKDLTPNVKNAILIAEVNK